MVCKKTQSKMNKKCLETKLLLKCKTSNFSTRKTSFLFKFTKISCSKYEGLSLKSAMHCKNLCKKTSFLATDATTQSSNQEENETRRFFFFISLQNNATRKNVDKNKTKRMKRKRWLKAQIAKESEHKMWKSNQDSTDSNTFLKTIKQIFFLFCLFYQNIN
jgi:hypothetical protein